MQSVNWTVDAVVVVVHDDQVENPETTAAEVPSTIMAPSIWQSNVVGGERRSYSVGFLLASRGAEIQPDL